LCHRTCSSQAGFTLIEVLVALAIVAALLTSIAGVIGSSVRGTRQINQRLALAGTAETLMASLQGRDTLKPGRQSGETAGHRWQVDIAPLALPTDPERALRWIPLAISLRVQAPNGPLLQVNTVRLAPMGGE
jgi:general secretion pathway protein I